MEVFYVLGGMIGFAMIVGLYRLFYCCESGQKPEEFKSCNELKAKQLEEASRYEAQKQVDKFLKDNTDKYKLVVTLKDGTKFESEVFEAKSEVLIGGTEYVGSGSFKVNYKLYYASSIFAKQRAEYAKDMYTGYLIDGFINPMVVYNNGFLKVGDVEINVNEILLKEVVKV